MERRNRIDHIAFNSWYLEDYFVGLDDAFIATWPVSSKGNGSYDIRDFRVFGLNLSPDRIVLQWEEFLLEDLDLMFGTLNVNLWVRLVLYKTDAFAQIGNSLVLGLEFAEDSENLEWGDLYPCQMKSWEGPLGDTVEILLDSEISHLRKKHRNFDLGANSLLRNGKLAEGYNWDDTVCPSGDSIKGDIEIQLISRAFSDRCNQHGYCDELQLSLEDGSRIIYSGEWANGAPIGKGEMIREFVDGEWQKFVGTFGDSRGSLLPLFVRGTSETSEGERFEGEFENFKITHGKATLNGATWEGTFDASGEVVGPVTITSESGLQYFGTMSNGSLEINKMIFPSGSRYEGEFNCEGHLHRHGHGCHHFNDKTYFSGEWLEDRPISGKLVHAGKEYFGSVELIPKGEYPNKGPVLRITSSDGRILCFERTGDGLTGPFSDL